MIVALIGLTAEEAVAVGTLVLAGVGALTLIANVFLLHSARTQTEATRLSADATLREARQVAEQVRTANEQVRVAEKQLAVAMKQAETADRALRAQVIPRLIPAEMDSCRIGPTEQILPPPQSLSADPVFIGVINAGNGAAVLEQDACRATWDVDGGSEAMNILVPPALAAGAQGTIKLTPDWGGPTHPRAGMIYTVALSYHAYGEAEASRVLVFTAQFFRPQHWQIQVRDT